MSKNGKPTLQDKAANMSNSIDTALETDYFYVSPEIVREIKSKGMVHRWINAKKLQDNYGFDRRQWKPYKKNEGASVTSNSFGGTDSEGYIRRGDLILAVRPQAVNDRVASEIRRKNGNLQKSQQKVAAEEMRQSLKESGVAGIKVHEGYDEND